MGRAIMEVAQGSKNSYIGLTSDEADICDAKAMERLLTAHNAEIVINCAAYTNVDKAETDKDTAFK